MSKKYVNFLCGLVVLIIFTGLIYIPAIADDEIKVLLNGTRLEFDVPPQIIEDRTMVPMREIFEALGTTVHWLNEDAYQGEQKILATKGTKGIWLQIGNLELHIVQDILSSNNEKDVRITLDVPPQFVDGRTLVPIRAVAEGLEMDVKWDEETQTVIINNKKGMSGTPEIVKNTMLNYGYITNVDDDGDRKIVQILKSNNGWLEDYRLDKMVNNYTVGANPKTFLGNGKGIDDFEEFFLGPIETDLRYVDSEWYLRDGSKPDRPTTSGRRGKLVKFETNSDGEICGIEFAKANENSVNDGTFSQYTSSGNEDYCVGAYKFDGDLNRLIATGVLDNNRNYQYRGTVGGNTGEGKTAYVDDNTIVYYIYVTDNNGSSCVDIDKSEVRTAISLIDGATYPTAQIFDVDSTGIAKAVVIYSDAYLPHNCGVSIAVIDSVSEAKNSDGDKVVRINFLMDGEKRNLLTNVDMSDSVRSLSKGTVVRFSYNSRGEIDGIYTFGEITNAGKIDEAPNITSDFIPEFNFGDKNVVYQYVYDKSADKEFRITAGPVRKFENGKLTVGPWICADSTTQAGIDVWKDKSLDFRIRSGVNFYIYDNSKNDVGKLTVGDIENIIGERSEWNDIKIGAHSKTGEHIPAPALAARDYVIIVEYDDTVTDVVIIKALATT